MLMSPPPSDNGSFVKAESFYPVDKEAVNNLFSDAIKKWRLRETRRAQVAAERTSLAAGGVHTFGVDYRRSFDRLIHIAAQVRTRQTVLAFAADLGKDLVVALD